MPHSAPQEPNEIAAAINDRMPAILPSEDCESRLSPETCSEEAKAPVAALEGRGGSLSCQQGRGVAVSQGQRNQLLQMLAAGLPRDADKARETIKKIDVELVLLRQGLESACEAARR